MSVSGDYEVCVKFNEDHIVGSPFPVTIEDGSPSKSNASKVRAAGRGLTAPRLGPDNEFNVDANDAGEFFFKFVFINCLKLTRLLISVRNYVNDGN